MRIELLTIGDELLLGFTIDTNGAHLARTLASDGIAVVRRTTVGDIAADIAAAVRDALDRTGAVITTGGLGPTSDDLTKPAIAALFGRAMRMDVSIIDDLQRRWTARGWPGALPVANRQQAMIPEGATILTNRHGSAPGIWLEDERGRWVAMLPGVPREMRGMLADELLPRLRARYANTSASPIVSRTLRTTGIAESALADRLGTLASGISGLSLAYLPGWEGVDLRLTSHDRALDDATQLLDTGVQALRERIGNWVYGEDADDLAAVVVQLLRERGLRIAVAESCTGGMLGMRLTAMAGSSDTVVGGVIAYADDVKREQLGVRAETLEARGAVSEETAREMAAGARMRLAADVGLSITGVAGPGGGTPEKPVGTVCFGVDVQGTMESARVMLIGDREEIRRRATQAALDLLRRSGRG